MGLVIQSPAATTTAYGNQRKLDRAQNGVLWAIAVRTISGGTAHYSSHYSTDNGATWTEAAPIQSGSQQAAGPYQSNASLFIDLDDYAHVVYKDAGNGYIYYHRGTPNAARTAYTWSAAVVLWDAAIMDVPDVVAFRNPAAAGRWVALAVASRTGSVASKVYGWKLSIDEFGNVSGGGAANSILVSQDLASGNSNVAYASVDFNHIGDGKTVKDGAPHWYVGWSAGATGAGYGIRFRKATYSAGSWTWGTEREIDNTRYVNNNPCWLNCMFDGTRVVLVGELYSASATFDVIAHDRDAADPSTGGTTVRNLVTTNNSTYIDRMNSGSASYNSTGDLYIFGASGEATAKLNYRVWTRATATLGALVTVDSTSPGAPYASARRGPQGQAIDYVYTDGTASPYTVTSGRIVLNQNPTATTPVSPADNATFDSAVALSVVFTHNDPDGDQSASWRIRYRPAGTTVAYQFLTGTAVVNNGANVTASVPANTWNGQVEYASQTYDPTGAEGAWSATRVATGVPTALAALTGGQGGTSLHAPTVLNMVQSERALRALSLV